MTDHQQPAFHANHHACQFEARIDGVVVFAATTAAPVKAFIVANGGVIEEPKAMSRSAARRMEANTRGRHGGYGVSRSGRRQ